MCGDARAMCAGTLRQHYWKVAIGGVGTEGSIEDKPYLLPVYIIMNKNDGRLQN